MSHATHRAARPEITAAQLSIGRTVADALLYALCLLVVCDLAVFAVPDVLALAMLTAFAAVGVPVVMAETAFETSSARRRTR